MSEGGEKTEEATPKRRQDARTKGQVARSPELSGAVALLVMVFLMRGAFTDTGLLTFLRASLAAVPTEATPRDVFNAGNQALLVLAKTIGLPIVLACAAGCLAAVAQVGLMWTPQPVLPDFNKINPLTGAARLFGSRGAVEAVKALLKMLGIGAVAWATLRPEVPRLIELSMLPTDVLLSDLGGLLARLTWRIGVAIFVLAVLDYAYQRWEHEKKLKMTKQEIKQEHKNSEGDPHIKAAIRQRQRDASQKRMMQDVPKADVVITNPTHFAVALAYEGGSMAAPKVLAKGQDLIAARIREVAKEHGVPLVENKPLARALYKDVEIGREIPAALFAAVAEVLAYVYQRDRDRQRRRARGW